MKKNPYSIFIYRSSETIKLIIYHYKINLIKRERNQNKTSSSCYRGILEILEVHLGSFCDAGQKYMTLCLFDSEPYFIKF